MIDDDDETGVYVTLSRDEEAAAITNLFLQRAIFAIESHLNNKVTSDERSVLLAVLVQTSAANFAAILKHEGDKAHLDALAFSSSGVAHPGSQKR
jgi:hypothetical protein